MMISHPPARPPPASAAWKLVGIGPVAASPKSVLISAPAAGKDRASQKLKRNFRIPRSVTKRISTTRRVLGVFSKSNARRRNHVKLAAAFGLRWQSAAATALLEGNQSGVALRLPPHSKTSHTQTPF